MTKTIHRKYDVAGKYNSGTSLPLSSCELRNIVSNSNSPVVITRVLRKALAGVENGVNSSYNMKSNYKVDQYKTQYTAHWSH